MPHTQNARQGEQSPMPSAQSCLTPEQHAAATDSLRHASDFLAHATELLQGRDKRREALQYLDFARRKLWQGEQELAGRTFTCDLAAQ